MVQNSKFTIQLLEKIGSPLAAAIESAPPKGEDHEEQAAKIMAQLLGQAVQISIALNSAFNIVEQEAQADSTRLALAAMTAPLLADFYRQNGVVPEDQDIKRIIKSLESVVAFADNFSAVEEEQSRLITIDHDAPLLDKTQASLVTMQVMTPAIMAIGEFAFGQSENKLIQEVAAKCEAKAQELAKNLNLSDKLSELMILKALVALYAECHRSETQKLAAQSDDQENRSELSLDPVWDSFATRTAMIEAVMGLEAAETSSKTPETTAPATPQEPTPKEETAAPTPPPAQEAAPATAQPSSPMGFFKKPDASAAPEDPPPAEPATPTPADEPVTPAPAEAPKAEDKRASPPETLSSPMGFFKPGAKKSDDGDS